MPSCIISEYANWYVDLLNGTIMAVILLRASQINIYANRLRKKHNPSWIRIKRHYKTFILA